MKSQDYAVIGLGKFGQAVVDTLGKLGKSVLAIDIDENVINRVANRVKYAVTLDSSDIEGLEGIGITKFENVILGIGNVEASIMTAVVLKELKIPNIIAKATSARHQRVLESIGVLNIIRPEVDAAKRTALRSIYKLAMDVTDINDTHSIIKVMCNNKELANQKLAELDVRNYNVNIVSIEREGKIIIPNGDHKLLQGDTVTFISENRSVKKFYNLLAGEVSQVDAYRIEKEIEKDEERQMRKARRKVEKENPEEY